MVNEEITIDGSHGEGGGQIVRSSMALAVVTGKALRIDNIRSGRAKPGLKRQHLTAVRAAREICDGVLSGDQLESRFLHFEPGIIRPGEYRFSVGSAGSAMLVLQTVLPPLLTATGPSQLVLEGGTHNNWAPPFDFLKKTYLPLIERMGPRVEIVIEEHGFYPAGGGRVRVCITPSPALTGFELVDSGRRTAQRLRALVANLPDNIGQREVRRAARKLNWRLDNIAVESVRSPGPGNVVLAEIEHPEFTEVFMSVGRRGVPAEKVADDLVRSVRTYQKCGAPVGEFLADQILLPLGLSAAQDSNCQVRRGGVFRTGPLSLHATTHIELLQKFLDVQIQVENSNSGTLCSVTPA